MSNESLQRSVLPNRRDVDFGIAIENWERFALLKERLVATGVFTSDRHAQQRLTYSDRSAFLIPIDLIPFRDVTAADGTIEWPPRREIVMNVAGFEEASDSSIPVQIEENLIVRVASIPGLMLLKLVPWSDRGRETDKDAFRPMLTPARLIASTIKKSNCWKRSVLTCKWPAPHCWPGRGLGLHPASLRHRSVSFNRNRPLNV